MKEKINITALTRLKVTYQNELAGVYTPPLILFGYWVQVIFAVLGIIAPLAIAYAYTNYIFDLPYGDLIAILLFVIGLGLSFWHIAREVNSVFRIGKESWLLTPPSRKETTY